MSYLLSTFTEVAVIDSRITSGTVSIPLTSSIPNRTFTVKDFYGAASNSTIILQTQAPDVFENGSSNLVINNNFGAITLYSGETGIWNVLTGSIQNSMTVSSLITSTLSISSYTFAINSNSFTLQNNTSTLLRFTGGNLNVSSMTLSSFSLYDSGLLSNVNIRLSSLTLLANNSSISGGGGGSIDPTYITSTVAGLGQTYLSTLSLTSTVAGLGQTYVSSILVGSNYINSTITGLGQTYVSTPSLTSTVAGLGQTYLSSILVGSNYINSTITGLGQTYVSTPSLTSTVAGLGQTYLSTPSLVSTVAGLGQTYLSTPSLQSTVAGLGQTYISAPLNLARISSLAVSTLALSTFTLFTQGPSSLIITNSNPGNFIVSSMNLGINTSEPLYPLDVNGVANFSSISLGNGNASFLARFQSLAIGYQAGAYGLGSNSLALGYQAGYSNQGLGTTALGQLAGAYGQGLYGLALGNTAGYSNQGLYGTAIGYQAGFVAQCNFGVAIGYTAGYSNQGSNAIAIGNGAGFSNQSTNSIAIGWLAGQGTTATSSIILNASGATLNSSTPGLFVKPVRFVTGAGNIVHFNTATSEIAYSDTTQLTSITAVNGSLTGTLSGGTPLFSVSTLAGAATGGSSNGTGDGARFYQPIGCCLDTSGNMFVVDTGFSIIRKIVIATGVVTTLAGTPSSYGSNDGIGPAAQFYYPQGMCYDGNGNLFVSDVVNQKIRKIVIATSNVTTFAGSGAIGFSNAVGTLASFNYPQYIAYDGIGSLFVTDNNNRLIRRINTTTSNVTSFAGGTNGSNDGVGLAASFNWLQGICSDSTGENLYVTDASNNNIRRINIATSNVTTIAGTTTPGSNDGIGAAARFTSPYDITADSLGNLYVADSGNNKIRKIVLSTSNVTTLAGTGGTTFADGVASSATFNNPQGITLNSLGQIFVTDRANNRIRLLSPLQPLVVSSNVTMNSAVNMVGRVGIGGSANSSNALLVTGDINYTGTLRQNGAAVTFSSPGINSAGNIGINSASNTSNALLVSGTQSNTGNLFVGGTTTLVASSNTGTLGVAGTATFSSNVFVNGTTIPGSNTLIVSKDIPFSNISTNQNPFNYAQVSIGGSTTSARLYLASAYTSGLGAGSIIQSSDYFNTADNGAILILNPLGGNVGVGVNPGIYRLNVNGSINFTGSLFSNGTLFSGGSVAGINSTGNIGINSASNSSNALFVSGSQSNTGNLFLGGSLAVSGSTTSAGFAFGQTAGINGSLGTVLIGSNATGFGVIQTNGSANTLLIGGTTLGGLVQVWANNLQVDCNVGFGVAPGTFRLNVSGTTNLGGQTTLTNSSNTGTLGVAGQTTLTNSSNTGTLGVAGQTTTSSNLGLFTNSFAAQFEIRGGANNLGNLGSNLISFQYGPDGGYRHFITTRHNGVASVNTNSVDFWLNNTNTAGGSSTAGVGNVNAMSVTAAGVGINCNAPGYNLDVAGTTNLNGAVRFKTNVSHIGDDGKAKVYYASNSATYYLATSHVFQTPASVNTFTVDSSGNTSNTGTIGVAGAATFSSSVSTRSFTNGRFDIYPTTANNYTIMGLSGGNNIGFIYGDYQLLGDGIHMGYNYYGSNGVAYVGGGGTNFSAGSSRISMGYGSITLNVGYSATLSTMVNITNSRVSISPVSTDYGFFAPTPTFVSSIAFTSSYNDLINGAPSYGIGRASSGITGLGPYTVAAGQLPLQIANYYGINFVSGQSGWAAGASHMAIVDGKVGIQNPAPSYTLDVNGPMQAAIFYSTITSGGTQTVTPNNFGIFYNITVAGTFTLAFAASQAASNIGKYISVRNNCGSTLSFTLTGVSGITSPVTLSNAQSATFVVATTTTYALF